MSPRFNLLAPLAALLCVLVATCSHAAEFADSSDVIQGEYAGRDDFKFLAMVHVGGSYHCDSCLGVKLSDWTVLVPAKCLNNRDDIQASVRVKFDCLNSGHCDYERGVDEIRLEEPTRMHPADSPGRFAILKMNEPVPGRGADKIGLMWDYYGHSQDWHFTLGFERSALKIAKFKVDRQGEFLTVDLGQQEDVSQLGSPVLIKDNKDKYKLVGIVSNVENSRDGKSREYRNLHDENRDIVEMVESLSPTPSVEADEDKLPKYNLGRHDWN